MLKRCFATIVAAALSACATQPPVPMAWYRTDGRDVRADQIETSMTICRGESQRAGLAAPTPEGIGQAANQRYAMNDVYIGCMAQQGYVFKPEIGASPRR